MTTGELALRVKDLATLRADVPLFRKVDELRWRGPTLTATDAPEDGNAAQR